MHSWPLPIASTQFVASPMIASYAVRRTAGQPFFGFLVAAFFGGGVFSGLHGFDPTMFPSVHGWVSVTS